MGLVVRLSPGKDPELEIHAADLKELDLRLRELRSVGGWSALKGAAREFADAPLAEVEAAQAVIEEVLPGAQVIADGTDPVEPAPPVDLAAEAEHLRKWNEGAVERAKAAGFAEANLDPPKQTTPRCKTCGATTSFSSGTGKGGKWSAYFCASGDRAHTTFL